jgi:hypothetical protein
MDKYLDEVLAKIAVWDGETSEPYQDWMGELDYPVHPEELLDLGMADLLPLMNIEGKTWTEGSCMHDPQVVLRVLDDEWFEAVAMPIILKYNEDDWVISLEKKCWGRWSGDLVGRGIDEYWDVVLGGCHGWWSEKKHVLEWYKAVYLAFEEINRKVWKDEPR